MGFLLEAGLEKLACWLRLLGQDALLLKGSIDRRALLEYPDRIYITTSRRMENHLKAWGINYLLLPRDSWELQLCLLIKHFRIEPELKLSRCYYCNAELLRIDRDEVRNKIPPMVYLTGKDFTLCPACGKIYWKGSHYAQLQKRLKKVLSLC